MREVLQIEPREVKDSLIEMGHTMINLEIVEKLEKPEKKPRKMTFRKKKEAEVGMFNILIAVKHCCSMFNGGVTGLGV